MAVVRFKSKAKRDIAQTLKEGALRFGPVSADRMKQRIEHCAKLLAFHPRMGKVELELVSKEYEYRSFVVHEHYKMVYRVDETKEIVYIVAFWDTRREPKVLVKETK